jgi:hypothetical protein
VIQAHLAENMKLNDRNEQKETSVCDDANNSEHPLARILSDEGTAHIDPDVNTEASAADSRLSRLFTVAYWLGLFGIALSLITLVMVVQFVVLFPLTHLLILVAGGSCLSCLYLHVFLNGYFTRHNLGLLHRWDKQGSSRFVIPLCALCATLSGITLLLATVGSHAFNQNVGTWPGTVPFFIAGLCYFLAGLLYTLVAWIFEYYCQPQGRHGALCNGPFAVDSKPRASTSRTLPPLTTTRTTLSVLYATACFGLVSLCSGSLQVYDHRFFWPPTSWLLFFGGQACLVFLYAHAWITGKLIQQERDLKEQQFDQAFSKLMPTLCGLSLALSGFLLVQSFFGTPDYYRDREKWLYVLTGFAFLIAALVYPLASWLWKNPLATSKQEIRIVETSPLVDRLVTVLYWSAIGGLPLIVISIALSLSLVGCYRLPHMVSNLGITGELVFFGGLLCFLVLYSDAFLNAHILDTHQQLSTNRGKQRSWRLIIYGYLASLALSGAGLFAGSNIPWSSGVAPIYFFFGPLFFLAALLYPIMAWRFQWGASTK